MQKHRLRYSPGSLSCGLRPLRLRDPRRPPTADRHVGRHRTPESEPLWRFLRGRQATHWDHGLGGVDHLGFMASTMSVATKPADTVYANPASTISFARDVLMAATAALLAA